MERFWEFSFFSPYFEAGPKSSKFFYISLRVWTEDGILSVNIYCSIIQMDEVSLNKIYLPNPLSKHRFVHQGPRKPQITCFERDDWTEYHATSTFSGPQGSCLLLELLRYYPIPPALPNNCHSIPDSVYQHSLVRLYVTYVEM